MTRSARPIRYLLQRLARRQILATFLAGASLFPSSVLAEVWAMPGIGIFPTADAAAAGWCNYVAFGPPGPLSTLNPHKWYDGGLLQTQLRRYRFACESPVAPGFYGYPTSITGYRCKYGNGTPVENRYYTSEPGNGCPPPPNLGGRRWRRVRRGTRRG